MTSALPERLPLRKGLRNTPQAHEGWCSLHHPGEYEALPSLPLVTLIVYYMASCTLIFAWFARMLGDLSRCPHQTILPFCMSGSARPGRHICAISACLPRPASVPHAL